VRYLQQMGADTSFAQHPVMFSTGVTQFSILSQRVQQTYNKDDRIYFTMIVSGGVLNVIKENTPKEMH